MRLVINRSQADVRGVFGGNKGVSFSLYYRLELTVEEHGLVQKYQLAGYALTYRSVNGMRVPDDTIANMLQGRTQTLSDVTTLIENENIVKSACDTLPLLLALCRSFGGDEVIEYPRDREQLGA